MERTGRDCTSLFDFACLSFFALLSLYFQIKFKETVNPDKQCRWSSKNGCLPKFKGIWQSYSLRYNIMFYSNVEAWQCSEDSLLNLQNLLEAGDFNSISVMRNSRLDYLTSESCNLAGVAWGIDMCMDLCCRNPWQYILRQSFIWHLYKSHEKAFPKYDYKKIILALNFLRMQKSYSLLLRC